MMCVFTLLVLCWSSVLVDSSVRIGAFNIKHFGDSKMRDSVVADQIKRIVSGYDIILLQEVRDKDESSLVTLRNMLQSDLPDKKFQFVASWPLGRSSQYKEQYAYFYRTKTVTIIDTYQFNDTNYGDVFEREPFSVFVRVASKERSLELALIGLHAQPTNAMAEINALDHVVLAVLARWQPKNLVVLGDLNADCRYAKEADLDATSVFTDFTPLIGHDADTTVKTSTTCAYDRINVHGSELKQKIIQHGVDDFEKNMGLTSTEAYDVSDHFPVDFSIDV
ncbi:deoxyribonuclease-1-like 2 isoform X2 [Gigantopelta aegis]|uniref:deoxyribonuclease-1-like 2 isoform X2 n=1 Tax=Gigantopelta aegis TaxID=1735272 RepID=UPI001B88E273|nr:deoxyribonuclease-1-like 2 isoform X2 [Gigantopelta aegis]XP_041365099.1 deoxyribonuclease-1-like 2 isoform X2 [Gigantopelta aegis]